MGIVMKGADVAAAMKERLVEETKRLTEQGILPCLGIVRVGARPDDLAYERGARKRMEAIGIGCQVTELPEDITQEEFEKEFCRVNDNPNIHGILLFRPLPAHLDEDPVREMIHPMKDVDGMSPVNIAKVFTGDESGYAPCTPEAVMEMLDYYKIDPRGKRVTVIGRSMVVGKPLSMLLLKRHATITVCHTRTEELEQTCREAEVLVAAAGKAKMVSGSMVGDGAVVVDVGINIDAQGNLCGDVDYDAVQDKASYISPVPRGVGSVTSSVLAKHVVRGAAYLSGSR
ncbi:bifunctional 5,10-methylenetetrahydrofolate dehydrogenase/5,10-methenyltetrahydrofolate cyclohydrolase [Extibacter muris]|uniref:bifunctional 5,10-methylenetetrahydrofolate dehydrogenase/5,10-methenyltetrahydrofolate cyclohydrolase n=1 Tax=Extibacter muris TaxID=1796622 RepID=UPI001D065E7A|nr:bifunctional 5,10-methylenetetrahydrofolate dehydrogenase/5,10-methenyltetrahydrofolate cyclohydrolase [Extibacter muris]MCB6200608.1 bifunctional 5,10-methylenetetrahydrofolate dehydrogenase/5,10-methenyltetrahydrofolate cyclohydrolase [Extibacter muris]MCQ4663679.1 bifunctional 5,10-methylenetetrahydrofolate dehydrogenase/5,10-methenyltetrahydrofolate cyclohydrolase [Extibacter muris]MCQ4692106.1 bifunctional 5,10-methylenetetrahydrofolate dehydrogenase/5,10-methenyltetrahydrofolate cyclohy